MKKRNRSVSLSCGEWGAAHDAGIRPWIYAWDMSSQHCIVFPCSVLMRLALPVLAAEDELELSSVPPTALASVVRWYCDKCTYLPVAVSSITCWGSGIRGPAHVEAVL